MRQVVIFAGFMILMSSGALAQQVSLNDLRGYSLIINQEEVINRRRGGTERRSWNEQIYVSSEGRVFHREDRKSDAGRDRFRENVGDAQGGGRKFSWTGDGFSRSWVNQRGRDIRQHIHVVRTQSGFSCAMDIDRTGRGTIDILRSSCRVHQGQRFRRVALGPVTVMLRRGTGRAIVPADDGCQSQELERDVPLVVRSVG